MKVQNVGENVKYERWHGLFCGFAKKRGLNTY